MNDELIYLYKFFSFFQKSLQRYNIFLIYANKKRFLTKNLLDCPLLA